MTRGCRVSPVVTQLVEGHSIVKSRTVSFCLGKAIRSLCSNLLVGSVSHTMSVLGRGVRRKGGVHIVNSCSVSKIGTACVLRRKLTKLKTSISASVPSEVGSKCKLGRVLVSHTLRSSMSAVVAYSGKVTTVGRVTCKGRRKVAVIIASRRRIPCLRRGKRGGCLLPPTSTIISPRETSYRCPFGKLYNTTMTCGLIRMLCEISKGSRRRMRRLRRDLVRGITVTAVKSIVSLIKRGHIFIGGKLRLLGAAGGRKLRTLVRYAKMSATGLGACRVNFILKPYVGTNKELSATGHTLRLLGTSGQERTIALTTSLGRLGSDQGRVARRNMRRTIQRVRSDS